MNTNPEQPWSIHVSAKDTELRLTKGALAVPEGLTPTIITLDEDQRFQTIEGFGASFTEASAIALAALSPDQRQEVLKAYFDPVHGHGYTLARTHINSCDFSTGDWDYINEGDTSLESFSLEHDEALLFPLIRDACKVAGRPIKLVASPWSPPAWMKSNGDMKHGGTLLEPYHGLWARYIVRYVQEATAKGLDIWGLTLQNEPQAVQVWESCIYSGEDQRDFIRDHLGPALHEAGLQDVKLMIWDHNKDEIFDFSQPILSDPDAARFVWGVAFHWYSGDDFENLDKVHQAFPDKPMLFTEGCMEGGVKLGSWASAERYAHDILGDLEHWTVGWIDWNMALDHTGGPNHVGNLCDAPVIADARTNTVHYQSSFWAMGHFSRFIKPGAQRIHSAIDPASGLEKTAFLNTDQSVAMVILNRTDNTEAFEATLRGHRVQAAMPPHSIATLIWGGPDGVRHHGGHSQ